MDQKRRDYIEDTKKEYQKIKVVTCPAFEGDPFVYFNKHGFTHLVRKEGKFRSEKEQDRRLSLLKVAVEIIQTGKYFSETRKETTAQFWEITKVFETKVVCVVIRQVNNGRKHFFSVKDYDLNP